MLTRAKKNIERKKEKPDLETAPVLAWWQRQRREPRRRAACCKPRCPGSPPSVGKTTLSQSCGETSSRCSSSQPCIPAKASLDLINNDNGTQTPDEGDELLHVLRLSQGHPVEGEDGLHQKRRDLCSVDQSSLDDCSRLLKVLRARVRIFLTVGSSVEVGNWKCMNL